MSGQKILVGTGKGLVTFQEQAHDWQAVQISFKGMSVSAFHHDLKSNIWWAAMFHKHWGAKMFRSENKGKDWIPLATPVYPEGAKLSSGRPASLKKVWSIQHTYVEGKLRLWVGTQPGGLFYSDDHGKSFHIVKSLWEHPSRNQEDQWFGTGSDQPFIHTIEVDPRDSKHIYIAVSSAGVFETMDYGQSWKPRNEGLVAAYLPNPKVEIGHDPHSLKICHSQPDVIWQQNHCGIFRSTNGGATWEEVSDKKGLANYGFAIVIDHQNPDRAWVIPATNDVERVPHDLALCVCRTEDAGKSWTAIRRGLPQDFAFDLVFRHSFDINKNRLVFGTTNGNLYLSNDFGASWQKLASSLQRIENITIV